MTDEVVAAEQRMKRWYRRRKLLLLLVVVGGGLAGFLYWFPAWAIKRASEKAIECTNQIYRTARGNAADCRQGGLLFIPKLLPWKRKQALQVEADIAGREAEDFLDLATKRDLDRAARDRGLERMFAVVRGSPTPDTVHATYYIARNAGDEHALIAHAAELTSGNDQEEALHAALHAGDRAAALKIAALPPRGEHPDGFERARGAILCAFGDRAQGIAALAHAEALWADQIYGYTEAKFGLAACDPARDVQIDSVWKDKVSYAQMIGGGPATRFHQEFQPEGVVASLVSLDQAGIQDIVPYLELVANSGRPQPTFKVVSPWSILGTAREYPVSPKGNDAVAARMIALADAFVPPKPKKHRRGEDDELPHLYGDHYIEDDARRDPRPYLRWGAMIVALDAAIAWMQRGDATKAQASAATAVACANHADTARIEPYAQILLPAVQQLIGLDADALVTVDALLARVPAEAAEARAVLAIQRAMLLVRAGKAADAWTALDPVLAAHVDARTYWNAAWLRAALALMLGRPLDVELPEPPGKADLQFDHPELTLAYWWAAATDPASQAIRRWRVDGVDPGYYDNVGVLPAQLYVIGVAAGKGDVELWLDVVTGTELTPWEAIASARAEVARWRGDRAAAAAWDQKLAATRALATDDRTAYLIQIALSE